MKARNIAEGSELEALMLEAAGWHVQVYEGPDGELQIYVHDHLNVTVEGTHKDEPTITVDSDEFPARLKLRDTEGSWTSVRWGNERD